MPISAAPSASPTFNNGSELGHLVSAGGQDQPTAVLISGVSPTRRLDEDIGPSLHKEFRMEYRLRRRDGEYRWAIDAASPRFNGEGEFLGYIGSVIDITERKQAEETLLNLNETLTRKACDT